MAAVAAIFHSRLRPGQTVLLPDDVYHGTRTLLDRSFAPWGVRTRVCDMTEHAQLAAALGEGGVSIVWVESPSNPLLKVTDIASVSELASAKGALTVVDATWLTPCLLRPLEHGADLVLHSATKYMGGHSDLLGGLVVGAVESEAFSGVRAAQADAGGVLSPWDSWLLLRGLRSLGVRMERHSSNALAVACALDAHPQVATVHYPGLPSHAQHSLASATFAGGFGGMLSFEVRGGEAAAMKVAASLGLFKRATSLGGTESLIEHRASIEALSGASPTAPPGLLRVSVGLEDKDELVVDLVRALDEL